MGEEGGVHHGNQVVAFKINPTPGTGLLWATVKLQHAPASFFFFTLAVLQQGSGDCANGAASRLVGNRELDKDLLAGRLVLFSGRWSVDRCS